MPKLGESITEGTIVSWSVKVGDAVQEDDVLFEVSTAKVSAEIPSPVAGKVLELLFSEGDTVAVGTTVALIQLEGEEGEAPESTTPAAAKSDESTMVQSVPAEPAQPVKSSKEEDGRWYSPIVLKLAQEAKISQAELDAIPGTGYEGRLSKKILKIISRPRKVASPHKVIPKTCVNRRRSPPSPIDVTHLLRSMVSTITNRRSPPSTIDATRHLSPKTKRSKWTALPVSYQTIWSCRKSVSPRYNCCRSRRHPSGKMAQPHERRIFQT